MLPFVDVGYSRWIAHVRVLTVTTILIGLGACLRRGRRAACTNVCGLNHVITLYSAASLSMALIQLGHPSLARTLAHDTAERGSRALGPDHPTTLVAEAALIIALVRLGEVEQARALGRDTVERSRRMYGADHPATLFVAQVASVGLQD